MQKFFDNKKNQIIIGIVVVAILLISIILILTGKISLKNTVHLSESNFIFAVSNALTNSAVFPV